MIIAMVKLLLVEKKIAIEILNENLKKKRKKGIILPVSAPFHCSLMKKAAENMKE